MFKLDLYKGTWVHIFPPSFEDDAVGRGQMRSQSNVQCARCVSLQKVCSFKRNIKKKLAWICSYFVGDRTPVHFLCRFEARPTSPTQTATGLPEELHVKTHKALSPRDVPRGGPRAVNSPQAAGTVQAPASPQGPGPPGYHSPRLGAAVGASFREDPIPPVVATGTAAGPQTDPRDPREPAGVDAGSRIGPQSPRASAGISQQAKPVGPPDGVEGGTCGTGAPEAGPVAVEHGSKDAEVAGRDGEESGTPEEDEAAKEERRALEVR